MCDPSNTPNDVRLRKHELTLKLRAEFQKKLTNPYRHALGEGGTVFDSGLARFQAMSVSNFEHFKPTGRSLRVGLAVLVIPMFLAGFAFKTERDNRERSYRNGEVAYKDRRFKLV